jgi:hypothetical protein
MENFLASSILCQGIQAILLMQGEVSAIHAVCLDTIGNCSSFQQSMQFACGNRLAIIRPISDTLQFHPMVVVCVNFIHRCFQ